MAYTKETIIKGVETDIERLYDDIEYYEREKKSLELKIGACKEQLFYSEELLKKIKTL